MVFFTVLRILRSIPNKSMGSYCCWEYFSFVHLPFINDLKYVAVVISISKYINLVLYANCLILGYMDKVLWNSFLRIGVVGNIFYFAYFLLCRYAKPLTVTWLGYIYPLVPLGYQWLSLLNRCDSLAKALRNKQGSDILCELSELFSK
jgi:hypothetical protein